MIGALIVTILIGLLAGYLAAKIMGISTDNIVRLLLLGLVGSFVGGIIGWILGFHGANILGTILLDVIGACVAVWLYNKYVLNRK